MKIKKDFVTNSSSSSFVLNKNELSEFQIVAIKNHIELAKIMHEQNPKKYDFGWFDEWDIKETKKEIKGYTSMDNFDMKLFLDSIGIEDVTFDDSCSWRFDD